MSEKSPVQVYGHHNIVSCPAWTSTNELKIAVHLRAEGGSSLFFSGDFSNFNRTDDDVSITPTNGFTADSSIFGLAKAFLSLDSMTHKKLQKLCYYAKAWYLALCDTNLVKEVFQAWVHGAVQPGLYQRYKKYGFDLIPRIIGPIRVPEEFLSFSKEVFSSYGHLSGDELEALNHSERPWREARGSLRPWEKCETVISEASMKDFYRSMIQQ